MATNHDLLLQFLKTFKNALYRTLSNEPPRFSLEQITAVIPNSVLIHVGNQQYAATELRQTEVELVEQWLNQQQKLNNDADLNAPLFDSDHILAFLTVAVAMYEHSAPAVSRYLNKLYERIEEGGDTVTLRELRGVQMLLMDGQWEQANFAQNRIYKLMNELGMDTSGMIDY